MKVSRSSQTAVQEWLSQADEEVTDAAEDSAKIERIGLDTLGREYAKEKQIIRDEIDRQARNQFWNADEWRIAMWATHRFSDEEIDTEYLLRLRDDQDYTDALYEMYEYPYQKYSRASLNTPWA